MDESDHVHVIRLLLAPLLRLFSIFVLLICASVRLLNRRIFDPVPDLCSKMSIVDIRQELDTFQGINFGLLTLITLHAKQYHA